MEIGDYMKKIKYPTYLDCYNCTDDCRYCPFSDRGQKKVDNKKGSRKNGNIRKFL